VRGGRGVLAAVAIAAVAACATPPARPPLEASGMLVSALPSEVRLAFEDYQEKARGRMLSISIRVAHGASQSLEGMTLVSATGQLAVGEGAARRTFPIVPWGSKRLPGRFQLAWMGKRPDGTDKQPAYYEYGFEPAPLEGLPAGAIDYELTAVIEWQGRQAAVSGRGRALPGPWRGSYPPPEPGTATRY
jgi:hypothetical protein